MGKSKIKSVDTDRIVFDDGYELVNSHGQDCCEHHYLDFDSIKDQNYDELEFDLSSDNFFTRVDEFGIQLNSTNNFPLRIPGYGYNNGYYSSEITLTLSRKGESTRTWDVSECQNITD